jgi:hypothetical protein
MRVGGHFKFNLTLLLSLNCSKDTKLYIDSYTNAYVELHVRVDAQYIFLHNIVLPSNLQQIVCRFLHGFVYKWRLLKQILLKTENRAWFFLCAKKSAAFDLFSKCIFKDTVLLTTAHCSLSIAPTHVYGVDRSWISTGDFTLGQAQQKHRKTRAFYWNFCCQYIHCHEILLLSLSYYWIIFKTKDRNLHVFSCLFQFNCLIPQKPHDFPPL